ncbi:MAG: rubrerythrin-like domain-containing protein [Halobacteriales archaeon]
MLPQDPFDPDRTYIECRECGHREMATDRPASCPECASETVQNLAIPRE